MIASMQYLDKMYKLDESFNHSEILSSYIQEEIKKNDTKPPLIIFDVDDTLLDTSRMSKKFPLFDGLDQTIRFYKQVQNIGCHTVLLTGRSEKKRDITIQNLDRLKIKNYDEIIFRRDEDNHDSFAKYKLEKRRKLAEKYTIIANIGDQITDFEGGYNGKIIQI
jgi:predicted secreted acid phosphatase